MQYNSPTLGLYIMYPDYIEFLSKLEYYLKDGEQMLIDTGYLAMMDATVKMEIQQVKGVKNVLFGGEGLFNTLVTGPGRIIIQSMPITNIAGMIANVIPHQK